MLGKSQPSWFRRPGKLRAPAAASGQDVAWRAAVGPSVLKSQGSPEQFLGLEDVHGPHHVLPADGALAHPLAAFGAGYHVAALQQHAVDDGVHADAAQVFVSRQLSSDTICGGKDEKCFLIFFFCMHSPGVLLRQASNYFFLLKYCCAV